MTEELRYFKNRRKFARANIYAIMRFLCPLLKSAVVVQTRISDISEGGVTMVAFKDPLPSEATLEMSFVMPGPKGQLVTVGGKVKYTRIVEKDLYQSGVEFLKLEKKDQLTIREYVASQSKK